MPRKLLVGGVTKAGVTVKKVSPPTVPNLVIQLPVHKRNSVKYNNNPCVFNGDHLEELNPDYDEDSDLQQRYEQPFIKSSRQTSDGDSYCKSQSQDTPMKKASGPGAGSSGQIHLAHVIVHSQPDTPTESVNAPSLVKGRLISGTQVSLEDQGIDVSSPGRHSPGGSSGGSSVSRHSLSSLDSGRASAPGSDGKVVNRRLSVHSYGDSSSAGSPQRRSYHSSSSSLASSGEDHTSSSASASALGQGPNVAEMVLHGLPDVEVLSSWLTGLHFEEYIPLFLQAGYDMPTITRMTPEDLTAIGITKPNHRRKLKAEIAKLNISDGIPEYKPDSLLEWLQLLRLEEYYPTLCQQHYDSVDKVTDLTWEDLEEIGIQKLGHQKKILLAIKRIEDINQGRRPNLIPQAKLMYADQPANYARPSTLGNVQPYPAQEITIAMHRQKNSPSTDSIPEMKTFQQSPIRDDSVFPELHHTAAVHHNGIANMVLSPSRGRSLESLHMENITTTSTAIQPLQQQPLAASAVVSHGSASEIPKPQTTKEWKTTDLDMDYGYECEGTATLNRPKGFVKYRPIAKIPAKTREEIAEIIMDIPDKDFKSLISQNRTLDGWSSLDGSPRHGPSTVPRASTLRRPPPPPPPKRSNSTKGERPETRKEDATVPTTKQKPAQLDLQKSEDHFDDAADEFPPPPSPLPSVVEAEKGKSSVAQGGEDSAKPMDELFNNPLFRQKRKDSTESSSSIDSTALPFANEAVGTIKQKVPRPQMSVSSEVSYRSLSKDRNKSGETSTETQEHDYSRTSDVMSPGHVIDDIEHMLANLSDQLDAMLDEEQSQK